MDVSIDVEWTPTRRMRTPRKALEFAPTVKLLREQGRSLSNISRELGIAKGTVERSLLLDPAEVPPRRCKAFTLAGAVVDAARSGKTMRQIANELETSGSTVVRAYKIATGKSFAQRRHENSLIYKLAGKIRELVQAGYSCSQIACQLNIGKTTVRKSIRLQPGLRFTSTSKYILLGKEVVSRWRSGKTIEQVAQELEIDRITALKSFHYAAPEINLRLERRKRGKLHRLQAEICRLHREGRTLKEITSLVGACSHTVRRALLLGKDGGMAQDVHR